MTRFSPRFKYGASNKINVQGHSLLVLFCYALSNDKVTFEYGLIKLHLKI